MSFKTVDNMSAMYKLSTKTIGIVQILTKFLQIRIDNNHIYLEYLDIRTYLSHRADTLPKFVCEQLLSGKKKNRYAFTSAHVSHQFIQGRQSFRCGE